MKKLSYEVRITPIDDKAYTIEIESDNIDWSMEQYARNRGPFTYEIVSWE
jgi:hypothetical protein|tara:strand:+ start:546 stop:695 length:150 start_codon:yes stop_codon:yes gene_type:complete